MRVDRALPLPARRPARPGKAPELQGKDSFQPAPEKEWTLLFYNATQGNLSAMTTHSLNELERVGSDQNTNVVALNYREQAPHEKALGRFKEYDGARTYYLTQGQDPSSKALLGDGLGSLVDTLLAGPNRLTSPVIEEPVGPGQSAQMSQEETLKSFLIDNMARYPAKRYALVLSGHGAAFQGQAVTRGPEGRAALSNDSLGRVLAEVAEEVKPIDLVNLNTCYSANLETLTSLKDSTRAIVASQAALALGTQPFGEVLNELQSRNGQVEAPEFAQLFVEKSKEQALSELHSPALAAFDASALGRLGDAVSKLQTSCMENGVSPEQLRECLAQAVKIDFAQEPRRVELTDLGSLTEVMSQKLSPRAVKKAAQKVREQLRQTVLAEQHSTPEQEGFLSKLVRRLPFLVGPQRSLEGATGLTVFWAPQESERLKMIAESQYGREHPLNEFMSYLGS